MMGGKVVRITQIDGKLPNLALMRLAAWHRAQGDDVRWERSKTRQLHEPDYDFVYGSAIFSTSAKAVALFKSQFPTALVGGEGADTSLRIETVVPTQFTAVDYSGHPNFTGSIGYASRGCRFKCGFCPVPKKEGKPQAVATVHQIWRGEPHPRNLHLLDNDFFGNPDWRFVVEAILEGGFKVCINQGVNVRLLDDEQARALVALRTWDDQFKTRRIYTAWDNIGDEKVFFEGLDRLEKAGAKPDNVMTYMLVGYDRRETWDRIWHRYNRMMERGVRPYPMVFGGDERRPRSSEYPKLKLFQAWVITGAHKVGPFEEFRRDHRKPPPKGELLDWMEAA